MLEFIDPYLFKLEKKMLEKKVFSDKMSIEVIEMDRIMSESELELICRRLSLGGNSGMNCALNNFQNLHSYGTHIDAKGIFAKYDGLYVGWALWTRETDDCRFRPTPGHVAFQIYVNYEFRRRGVGTKLIQTGQKILKSNEMLNVYYSDNPEFFRPYTENGQARDVRTVSF